MIDWREQEVRNETSSREINEWIDESNQHSGLAADPFVCECSDASCPSTIALTHLEYEGVRAHATYFAIATDHETPDLDAMVSEHPGFTIVLKLPGMPARVASASDPRRTTQHPRGNGEGVVRHDED